MVWVVVDLVPESRVVFVAVISDTSVLPEGSEEERLSSPESEICDI